MRLEVSTITGGWVARIVPSSGIVTAASAEQLEQERLEVVVGAVDLVDQQHRRPRPGMLERAQQRPADQVVAARTGPPRAARRPRASARRMLSSWRG